MTSHSALLVVGIPEPVHTFRITSEKSPVFSQSVNDDSKLCIRELLKELADGRLPEELTYSIGAKIINATFTLSKQGGGMRFNNGAQGAWYCAFELWTAIKEVTYHRMRELDEIGVYEDEVVYQELLAEFAGPFHDARGLPRNKGVLGSEPKDAYPLGQKLAGKLMAEGGRGIIYPSVRRPKGTCLVAFHPQMVQNFRFGKRWKISWNGSREYTVEEHQKRI